MTTAAQYFHLLRRQALDATARPLVVMTPKGLLRLKQASSALADFSEGRFRSRARRPGCRPQRGREDFVLTSGKLYYDIQGHEERSHAGSVAVARIEQLYPFPVEPAAALTASYPYLRELVWAQEEPQNMGALAHDPAPARRQRARTVSTSRTPEGPGARARARATRLRTASSRTGSFARRSAAARRARASACAVPPARRPRSSGRQCAPRASSGGAARAAAGARGRKRRRRDPDRTGGADARHGSMFAHAAAAPRL